MFAKDVLPTLGKCSIYDIKRPDLLEVIAKIEKRKALSVAKKVRPWFNQLFRYALVIVRGLEQNPASDLDVVAMPLPAVNHNALPVRVFGVLLPAEVREIGDAQLLGD
ncbi:Putative prophage CPS-53 integrase [Variovorax sp. SRS16]|nr:Putative prophage CPS-53 integrase [Variovorax sp. SRS16]